ncbi:hypothetical protein ABU162_04995 [Paenibacillus thiaminolyticus]|uniref:hypothetical protein n=1 Tax=Paenibacillus thiaminolyticus TaxID=49283 RepID=UPI0035A67936
MIKSYLDNVLLPKLISFGATSKVAHIVKDDVHKRLISIISRWDQQEFRDTVLLTGLEESFFYEPEADLKIKSLVVVAIRNSLIEDMKSTIKAAKNLGLPKRIIDDQTIKIITYEAIKYFNEFDFNSLAIKSSDLDDSSDPYRNLKDKFPLAWKAMYNLSLCQKYIQYPPLETTIQHSPILINSVPSIKMHGTEEEVQSGLDSTIDIKLQQILELVIRGEQPFFFCDCFKMISRNPAKLFNVVNIVLTAGAPVVTSNYYISNGYVARREKLLRPAHNKKDMALKLNNTFGLRKSHSNILKIMRASI